MPDRAVCPMALAALIPGRFCGKIQHNTHPQKAATEETLSVGQPNVPVSNPDLVDAADPAPMANRRRSPVEALESAAARYPCSYPLPDYRRYVRSAVGHLDDQR